MKAKFISEVQNFTQGGNPYTKLNIGKYDEKYNDWADPYHQDCIELQENIFFIYRIEVFKKLLTETKIKQILNKEDVEHLKGDIFQYDADDESWVNTRKVKGSGTLSLSQHFVIDNKESFKKIRNT